MKKELTITEVARLGGIARRRKLSKKRRVEIATIASMAAKEKRKKLSTGNLARKNTKV